MNRERGLQSAFIRTLNMLHECMAVSYYSGAIFDPRAKVFRRRSKNDDRPPGFPDIVGVYRGRAFAIEVKTDTGVLSSDQKRMHELMRRRGWPVAVCRTVGEVLLFINGLGVAEKPLNVCANGSTPTPL